MATFHWGAHRGEGFVFLWHAMPTLTTPAAPIRNAVFLGPQVAEVNKGFVFLWSAMPTSSGGVATGPWSADFSSDFGGTTTAPPAPRSAIFLGPEQVGPRITIILG